MSGSSGYLSDISLDGLYNNNNNNNNNNGNQATSENSKPVETKNNFKGADFKTPLKRKRRLPELPMQPLPRPRKDFKMWFKSHSELYSRCCGYSRLVLVITLSVMALAALGAVIYLVYPRPGYGLLIQSISQDPAAPAVNFQVGPAPEPLPTILPSTTTTTDILYECPCEVEYELISGRGLVCELKVIGATTVLFDKVSGENPGLILSRTGIRIPNNVPKIGRFSAEWKPDGTLITNIDFSPVQCHDEGNYSLTVTSQAGTKVHYVNVKVMDFPENITISIPNGLIEDRNSGIECQASTGCKKTNMILEATDRNGQTYFPWARNGTQEHYQEGGVWKTKSGWKFTKFEVDNLLHNRSVKCTYSIDDKNYYSQPICMKIVPANFCTGKTQECEYPHPHDCNKYITCTTGPTEMHCKLNLHFLKTVNCKGECTWPKDAKCNILHGSYCGGT